MPVVVAAVCPHPPMIVPEIAGAAASELDELRRACDEAIGHLLAAEPEAILVVGSGAETRRLVFPYRGTFRRWGSAAGFRLGDPDRLPAGGAERSLRPSGRSSAPTYAPVTALSLIVGGWLLARHDLTRVTIGMETIAATAGAAECAALGAALAERRERVALLVMGDGSACRGRQAPGYDDPRAQPYDDGVAVALTGADGDALLDLDPDLSTALMVAGRAPWQVLAGAVRASGGTWRGELSYRAAPYGVAYFVATWRSA